ncbi:hypothetical protein [Chlamydiifrater volucris]|uniref:hypothetical protein n=1 Tax=Chlamydiifrater volucris TaxID=2681470 RepID=UPI001BCC39F1|nr:hypothetical protein [Chlamydiifrater volucris]
MDRPSLIDIIDKDSVNSTPFSESTSAVSSIQDSLRLLQKKLESAQSFDEMLSIYEEAFAILNPALQTLKQTHQEYKVVVTDDKGYPLKDTDNNPIFKDFAYEEYLS